MEPKLGGLAYEREEVAQPRYAVDHLPEFLTMRIAEEVKVADGWPDDPLGLAPDGHVWVDPQGHPIYGARSRVLADCDARLKIVHRHARVRLSGGTRCHCCWSHEYAKPSYPCETLLYLAQPFAGHPDFREEWVL